MREKNTNQERNGTSVLRKLLRLVARKIATEIVASANEPISSEDKEKPRGSS